VWRQLGHRPSRNEWEASNPRYSYTTYKTRFHGWINACIAFIDFKSGGSLLHDQPEPPRKEDYGAEVKNVLPDEEKRNIPLKLRLAVLKRDSFRCVFCGKSPATHAGVALHIDHMVPFSEGGRTEIDNLQTLCEECNLGKGNAL
jgi:hypothetical protein